MVEEWSATKTADSFNYRQQAKQYMLKVAAPRHTYIIDYFDMANSKISYLLAVNANTRKAYAITPPNTYQRADGTWVQGKYGNKTAETAVKQLEELLRLTNGNVKHLISDQEAAFISHYFRTFCRDKGIELRVYHKNDLRHITDTTDTSRGIHSTLGILDRVCRTIRGMHYNITGNASSAINPDLMQAILDEYNRSPHTTLSKVLSKAFGRPLSIAPNDVTDELEDILVQEALKHNLSVKSKNTFDIIGKTVMCYNEAGKFDKVRSKLLPGKWRVVGKDGGLFVVEKPRASMRPIQLKLPRYMLKVVDPY
jgi:hypothetical protein